MSHPGSISISLGLSKDRTVVFRVIVPNKISSKVMSSFFRHLKPSKSGASSSYADAENQSSRGSVVSASSIKSTAKNEGEAYGIHSWVEGKDPILDIVFIHGLNGHREQTWTAVNGFMWPKELLGETLAQARILGFGYDSRTHALSDLSNQTLHGHATTLLQRLSLLRRSTKTERRPIIFVAHSLGGLVLKAALLHANIASRDNIEHYKAIIVSCYGILFMGTPHQGGNGVPMGKLLANMASIAVQTNKTILEHLEKNSEYLEQQSDQYRFIADQFDTKFCYETIKTTKFGFSGMVVDKNSAIVPGQSNAESIEMHKSHTEMTKAKSAMDQDIEAIVTHMELMCQEAPRKVQDKWESYDRLHACDATHRAGGSLIKDNYQIGLHLKYKPNSFFTGREQMLNSLHEQLKDSNVEGGTSPTSVVVLIGTGGVGKTQLARQYAYQHSSLYSSISWISGTSLETAYEGFHEIAQRVVRHYAAENKGTIPPYTNLAQHLGMPGLIDGEGRISPDHVHRSVVVEAVKSWLAAPQNADWLLIFDNVDDLDSFNIGDFLPTTVANGNILITTRRRECTRFGTELELKVMVELESIELLRRSCQRKQAFTRQEHEEASKIVKRLGHLPLAIDQAGAFLYTMQKPLATYLPLLASRIKETLSQRPGPRSVWQYEETVFSTWELSFREIQSRDSNAAEIMTLCSFLSSVEIQPELLERGLANVDPKALPLDKTTFPLLSFSLIARLTDSESFTIHPLVHDCARERLANHQKTAMVKKAFKTVCFSLRHWEIWTTGVREPQDWQYERRIMPHIAAVLHWVGEIVPEPEMFFEYGPEMVMLANVYFYDGRYSDAEDLYLRALAGTEKRLGPDHPQCLNIVQGLATVNRFQGQTKWKVCQGFYERVLNQRKKLDPNHLDTLATVQSLAVLHRHQGRLDQAVELYKWALYGQDNCGRGIETQQGPSHPNTIHTVFGYAIVLQHQGKYKDAIVLYERVLEQRRAELGPNHPDTLTAMQNVADAARRIGELPQAESLFCKVLDAREKKLGPLHPDTLRTAEGLANVYRDQYRFDKSEKLYSQALSGREARLGFEHADTLATIHNVAISYRMQGRFNEANTYYLHALQGRERKGSLGPGHLDTIRTAEGLGMVAEDQHEYDDAIKWYRGVLEGFEAKMPEECPEVMRAVENLARVLEKQGRHEDAVPHLRRLSSASSQGSDRGEAEVRRLSQDFLRASVSSSGDSGAALERFLSNSPRRQSVRLRSDSIREEPEIEALSEDALTPSSYMKKKSPPPSFTNPFGSSPPQWTQDI